MIAAPSQISPPYSHSITVPLLEDHIEIDVTDAFRKEGVDIDGMILLSNGKWDNDVFVAPKADGSEERVTEAEIQSRYEQYLGRFRDEVGTLAGEISFKTTDGSGPKNAVKFSSPVYRTNQNRCGIPKPLTCKYDVAFEIQKNSYEKLVQISHSLGPGDTDRFIVKVAVAQSSFYQFRASLRDVSGLIWQSFPIEMNCFVPRSRRRAIENAMSSGKTA
jgi:hypothetical protein